MKEIPLEEALSLVRFEYDEKKGWQVLDVNGDVNGAVDGNIVGNIFGNIGGNVSGDVLGSISGNVRGAIYGNVDGIVKGIVKGKINSRKWTFIETPKEKFQRLLQGTRNQELIDTFNQLEDNS